MGAVQLEEANSGWGWEEGPEPSRPAAGCAVGSSEPIRIGVHVSVQSRVGEGLEDRREAERMFRQGRGCPGEAGPSTPTGLVVGDTWSPKGLG